MVVQIDPVIFSIGPLQVRWYALMYVIGFLIANYLLKYFSRKGVSKIPVEKVDSIITYSIVGMFLGSRITYVFIYNWDYYSKHFAEIIAVWKGGLSFHGAVIGMAIAFYLFARKNKLPYLHILDSACLVGSQGLFFGRMGNFINGELYGRVTDLPWGMIFPPGGPYPRHPSQLYEAICEGLVLFVLLYLFRKKMVRPGFLVSLFLMGYGMFRFLIEFVREADVQLGYYFAGHITMGQILCFLMLLSGAVLLIYISKKDFRLS